MITGIVCGLLAALGHSLAYLSTRWYTVDRGRPLGGLLVKAHVMIGGVAAGMLPVVWPDGLGLEASWLILTGQIVFFFIIAQVCLMSAVRRADASRVAPILGLKIAVLAVLSVLVGGSLGGAQWAAVGLAVAAAWMLNAVGGRLPWRVTALVVGACLAYAIDDMIIVAMVREVERLSGLSGGWTGPLFTVSAVYTALGLCGLCLLPWHGSRSPKAWRDAGPYAVTWLGAMIALYMSFATVGTVLGAILQSSRGIISILLGIALASMGWHHLEQKHGWGVQFRRLIAAALMCLAVWLYVKG
ncbi:MAG: EamA family transporter [Planctomycetota bacterium]